MQPLVAAPPHPRRRGTFDWVLEARGGRATEAASPPARGETVREQTPEIAFASLWRVAHRLGRGFDDRHLLEVETPKPLLVAALRPASVRSLTVLLEPEQANLAASWSSRFPHAQFFVGAPACLASIATGGFEWIVAWNRRPRGSASEGGLERVCLARLLATGGLLASRERLDRSRTEWARFRGDMDRARLKPLAREDLPDGTSWVVARRG